VKRLVCVLAVLATVIVGAASPASAADSKSSYAVVVGEDAPNVARAANGDTVAVTYEGEFNGGARTVSGEGHFQDQTADGTPIASGTFIPTRFISFQFYGCGVIGGQEIPPNLCGGRLTVAIHFFAHPADDPSATVEGDGLMEVNCQIGTPPPATSEGTTIRVGRFGNFNEHVSGDNVFVAQD
jgi:endonuclease YncB( thermonuclease family)